MIIDNVLWCNLGTTIAKVRPVRLMNVVLAPGGRQPSDQTDGLGLM